MFNGMGYFKTTLHDSRGDLLATKTCTSYLLGSSELPTSGACPKNIVDPEPQ